MEKLDSFDFDKRPSRSRYAPVVKAMVEDGVKAVRLKRGEDFPQEVNIDSVQSAVADQVRKAGKHAQTHRESEDSLVVGLQTNPRPARRRPARAVAAV
jgi:hypothetical protein